MPSNLPRRLARSIAAATLASVAAGGLAHDNDRDRHRLPRLSPAKPAALIGACEDLAARLAGLPNTVITGSATIAAGTLSVAGQPIAEHCRVTGKIARACEPGRWQDLCDPVRDAPAQGLERPLLPPGQRRHRRQRRAGQHTFGGGALTSTLLQGFAVLSSDAGHANAPRRPGVRPRSAGTARLRLPGRGQADADGQAGDRARVRQGARPFLHRRLLQRWAPHAGGRGPLAEDYDGYLAGAPGYNCRWRRWPTSAAASAMRRSATGDPTAPAGLETAFTTAERKTVADAVLARCDALDGVR